MSGTFAFWLQMQLNREDLNASGLAAYLGVRPSTVSYWLANKTTPNHENARKLADILHVDIREVYIACGRIPIEQSDWPEPIRRIATLLMEATDEDVQICENLARMLVEREEGRRRDANSEGEGGESD